MFIAMNRFKIAPGRETDFETVWRTRESFLDGVPGFESFHLLKGPSCDTHTLYASHSVWQSRAAFFAWTQSDAFRKAHAQANPRKGTYLGHPELETFESII
jgi:heme-degrading monooxygenase HmoA